MVPNYRRLLWGIGCLTMASVGTANAQVVAQSSVRNALLAQVIGFGGCYGLDVTTDTAFRFFPTVRFTVGTCILEHGDTARPIVARDSSGVLYVLDSPSAFQFLVRQHPPVGLDSSTAVDYAKVALAMQGKLPLQARMFTGREPIDSLCKAVDVVCGGLQLPGVTRLGHRGVTVRLTAFTSSTLYSESGAILYLDSGFVSGSVHMWYRGGQYVR